MHKFCKKFISFILTVLMIFSTGIASFAAESDSSSVTSMVTADSVSSASVDSGDSLISVDSIDPDIDTNELKFMKSEGGNVESLDMLTSCTEAEGKVCLCQGFAFRVAQQTSKLWSDGIFRSYEVEKITTGWSTDGAQEMLVEKLHVANVTIDPNAAAPKDLSVDDARKLNMFWD